MSDIWTADDAWTELDKVIDQIESHAALYREQRLRAEIERLRERLKGSDMLAHVRGEQIERLRAALREAAIFMETAAPFLPDDVTVKHSFNNGETLQTRPLSVVLRACAQAARRALEGK